MVTGTYWLLVITLLYPSLRSCYTRAMTAISIVIPGPNAATTTLSRPVPAALFSSASSLMILRIVVELVFPRIR